VTPIDVQIGDGHVRFTGRAEGDLGPGSVDPIDIVERRRRAVLDRPWSWVRQVHRAGVVVVHEPGGASGTEADALVTTDTNAALAIFTADCAPIALVGGSGGTHVLAAAHAGWRGLMEGVVDAAVDAVRAHGASTIEAAIGPCIHVECYAFSPADLDGIASRFGPEVRGTTSDGQPALDVPAMVRSALGRAGVEVVYESDVCTGCSHDLFSHRARRERERQAMLIWSE